MSNKKWCVICQTDGRVETISATAPTVCPVSGGHTIGDVTYLGDVSFYYEEDDSEDTFTGDTNWHEKVTLDFTPLIAQDYMIEWTCEMKDDSISKKCFVQCEADNTILINSSTNDPESTNDYRSYSGFKKVNFSAAAHYIDIDVKCEDAGGMVTTVRNARIKVTPLV